MAKDFNELRSKLSPARRRRNKSDADRILLEIALQEPDEESGGVPAHALISGASEALDDDGG